MTAQHTPGPWHAGEQVKKPHKYALVGFGNGAVHIGYVSVTPACDPIEADANLRLIIKAPELVAGLRNIVKMLDGSQPKDPVGALMSARYLVHLATGGKA